MTAPASVLCVLVVAAMAAASAWALGVVPRDAQVAVHFGLDGTPDGFASPEIAFAIMPLAAVFTAALLALLPRLSPLTRIPDASRTAYSITSVAVILVLAAAHAMIIARSLGVDIPVIRWMAGALGLMFVVTGNYAGKIHPNAIFGVRTPWTLRDSRVWARTHRLFGWLSVALGLALLGLAFFGPPPEVIGVSMLLAVIAMVVVVLGYAMLISRRQPTLH